MNFDTMSKQRKFVLIAAAVGVISMFLPWFSLGFFGSINGMHSYGILVFLCFAGSGVLAFLGDQTKTLDKTPWMIVLIASGIASLLMVIWFIDLMGGGLSVTSFGFYIALAAALAILFSAYQFKSPTDNIKEGFDNLKKEVENKMKSTSTPGNSNTGGSTPPSSDDTKSSGNTNPPM